MKWGNSIDELLENWEGIGKDLTREDVDPRQLEMGIEVELEHTDDRGLAEKITLDHLKEDSEYYTKLQIMEEGL